MEGELERENTVAICMIFETFLTKYWRYNKNNKLLGWEPRTEFHTLVHILVIQPTHNHA